MQTPRQMSKASTRRTIQVLAIAAIPFLAPQFMAMGSDQRPIAADPGPPPGETNGYSSAPTYAETWDYMRAAAAACSHIQATSFGRSTEGYPLPMALVYDRSGIGGAWDDGTPKPVVLITACIHSGESCGNDALLLLLRDLARGAEPDLVRSLRLVLVPILNVDGYLRRSLYNRFTQVGPATGFGTRRNAQGLDLNRDYAKLETPECQALVRLAAQIQPHIFIDLHTDDGFGHQYELLFDFAVNPTTPGRRDALVRDRLVPAIHEDLAARGFNSHPTGWLKNDRDLTQGLVAYGLGTRYSTGYFETRQCISLLTEAYPYIPYEQRVHATDAFNRAVLHFAAANRIEICEAVADARRAVIAWADEPGRHEVALGCRADTTQGRPIRWLGKKNEKVTSPITHETYLRPGNEDILVETTFFDRIVPRATATMPRGYFLEAAWTEVAQTLKRHSITVHRLGEPFEAAIEVYRFSEVEFDAELYQGHHRIDSFSGTWTEETSILPAGTYWIPMDQPAAVTAMQLLEPEAQDALLVWNAFDTIFEPGIILDTWALEDNARRLMEDPVVRAEFEAALDDSAFALDAEAQRAFFFQRTPYAEERRDRYPVCRYLGPAPLQLIP